MDYASYLIKKLIVDNKKASVKIDLEKSTIVNGEVTSVIASNLTFNKGDDISSQPEVIQKACADAWLETKIEV